MLALRNNGPTLGMMIRGLRMGYGWTGHSFLRISGSNPFKCEFRPCELIPCSDKNRDLHYAWWPEHAEAPRIDLGPIARVKAKRHFILYVDDNGMPV